MAPGLHIQDPVHFLQGWLYCAWINLHHTKVLDFVLWCKHDLFILHIGLHPSQQELLKYISNIWLTAAVISGARLGSVSSPLTAFFTGSVPTKLLFFLSFPTPPFLAPLFAGIYCSAIQILPSQVVYTLCNFFWMFSRNFGIDDESRPFLGL